MRTIGTISLVLRVPSVTSKCVSPLILSGAKDGLFSILWLLPQGVLLAFHFQKLHNLMSDSHPRSSEQEWIYCPLHMQHGRESQISGNPMYPKPSIKESSRKSVSSVSVSNLDCCPSILHGLGVLLQKALPILSSP